MRPATVERIVQDQEGFTLAELIVVISITILLVIAVGGMIRAAARSSSSSHTLAKVQEAGNEALDTMVRQIRGAVSISPQSNSSRIIFAADVDGGLVEEEGVSRFTLETAQFDLEGGYLRKGYCPYGSGMPPMQEWIADCTGLTFSYWVYDPAIAALRPWDPSTDPVIYVKRVDVELRISGKALGGSEIERVFTGSATMRNDLQELF